MKRSEMITYLRKNIEWVDESPNWASDDQPYKCDEDFADYILSLVETIMSPPKYERRLTEDEREELCSDDLAWYTYLQARHEWEPEAEEE